MKQKITLLLLCILISFVASSQVGVETVRDDTTAVIDTRPNKRQLLRHRREAENKKLLIGGERTYPHLIGHENLPIKEEWSYPISIGDEDLNEKHENREKWSYKTSKSKKSKSKSGKDSKTTKSSKSGKNGKSTKSSKKQTKSSKKKKCKKQSKNGYHDCLDSASETPDVPDTESEFNLQDCATYDQIWVDDISESCNELLGGCKCPSAKMLIDSGIIDCEVDRCPDDCIVCSFCLEDVLGCFSAVDVPNSSPNLTDVPSPTPSFSPSVVGSDSPTASPSSQITSSPSRQPLNLYDLSNCDEYSPIWRFELIVSQQCESAQELVDQGLLTCDSSCPDNCPVCDVCLSRVIDCD